MTKKNIISTIDLRQNNKNRIYLYIYNTDTAVTKQNLSLNLNLSLPTITSILKELRDGNLIIPSQKTPSTGGRKANTITINKAAKFSVGIQITDNRIIFLIVDLKLNILVSWKMEIIFKNTEHYYATISQQLETVLTTHNLDRGMLLGIGITIPGIIHQETNFVEFAPTLNIHNKSLEGIKKIFPYPIFILNDADASGFAEQYARPNMKNMAYLSLDHGVGGAIILNGTTYLGNNNYSAEFGHLCIVPNGKQCKCGKCGCLEAYCSTSVLSDDLSISIDEFFEHLKRHDKKICARWEEYLNFLVHGIVNIQGILDCPIVIGGQLAPFMDEYLPYLIQKIDTVTSFESKNDIFTSKYDSKNACIGAALYFVDNYIKTC